MEKTKKKKKWKWPLIILGVVVVAALVIVNLQQSHRGVTTVQSKSIEFADIVSEVSGSGRVEPKTKVNITSEVNAEIIAIEVKEGDYVYKGQTLIQLDTVQLKSDQESAVYAANELRARVEGSQVLLDQRKEEYDRQKNLFEKKLTSEQVYKDAMYSYLSREAEHNALVQQEKAALSRLAKANDNLSKTKIKSPMDGVLTLVDVEVGEIAQAQTAFTQGRTLMTVSDLSAFEVEVEIDETDIADLEVGQKTKVEIDAFPDTVFAGEVSEIGNTATLIGAGTNDQATNFKVKVALLDNNPKIRPGMSATVDITTKSRDNVLAVPIQAVVYREIDPDSASAIASAAESEGGNVAVASEIEEENDEAKSQSDDETKLIEKKGVFVIRDGVAEFVEVNTGISDQQNYEVIGGLNEGDEVITGSFRTLRTIKSGAEVKIDNSHQNQEGKRE